MRVVSRTCGIVSVVLIAAAIIGAGVAPAGATAMTGHSEHPGSYDWHRDSERQHHGELGHQGNEWYRHHRPGERRRVWINEYFYVVPRVYVPPTYWYCPSYDAYYPHVDSCPDSWVPVPAS